MSKPLSKSAKRLIRTIVIDLLVLGVFLAVFSYVHFLRVPQYEPKTLNSPTAAPTATATPEQTDATPAEDAATPTPEVVDTGLLGGKYADQFTDGAVEQTDTSYRSANVSIEMSQITTGTESKPVVYYLADIYVKDISSFRTGVAFDFQDQNEGSRKNVMSTLQLSQLVNSIVAISGDNFTYHDSIAVRNGVEWDKTLPVYGDICVLYYDGTMETYPEPIRQATLDEIYAKNPYQIWTFGPELLEDGQVPSSFAGTKANPLSSIGYFEPGHYCFILVDGRQKDYSWGMTLSELAQVYYDLGCKVAFNLDGGDTAVMTYNGEWRSQPQDASPRDTSDILYICEPTASANGQ
ncbi:MAG: phosphodiester glycosidase family protein [Clostridiales bacterium]|nr:phosphodiester glycosidase family protein [Clostridiales bacterium]